MSHFEDFQKWIKEIMSTIIKNLGSNVEARYELCGLTNYPMSIQYYINVKFKNKNNQSEELSIILKRPSRKSLDWSVAPIISSTMRSCFTRCTLSLVRILRNASTPMNDRPSIQWSPWRTLINEDTVLVHICMTFLWNTHWRRFARLDDSTAKDMLWRSCNARNFSIL